MAIYPGATFKPTTWGGKVARNKQGRGILHVAVSERASYPPFSGNTWHFYVGKAAPNGATDGSGGPAYCEQYVDTEYRAYGDVDANDDAIVVETAGAATPAVVNTEPWTRAQQLRIADLMRWESQQPGGAPLQLLPDAKAGRTGWGPHRLGIKNSAGLVPGWWFPGCEVWSTALGKECPGDAKVRQVPQIIEEARTGQTEDDMTPEQDRILGETYRMAALALSVAIGGKRGAGEKTPGEQVAAVLAPLTATVGQLVEAVSKLQAGGAVSIQAVADQLTVVPKS